MICQMSGTIYYRIIHIVLYDCNELFHSRRHIASASLTVNSIKSCLLNFFFIIHFIQSPTPTLAIFNNDRRHSRGCCTKLNTMADRRTCMPNRTPSRQNINRVPPAAPRRQPTQRQRQEYEQDASRGRKNSVIGANKANRARDVPAIRDTRFRPSAAGGGGGSGGGPPGSRELLNRQPSFHQTAAQRWFTIMLKQGGITHLRRRFIMDLHKYKTKGGTTTAFGDQRNADFNRYTDVELLDATRVKLRSNPGGSDYVHASHVRGAEFPLICAQGPLDETIERFWIMVVEQNCGVIVQLCQNEEDGKEKCAEYLPNMESAKYGNVSVQVAEKTKAVMANPQVKKTVLQATFGGRRLQVYHFLYDGWPDHDVPLAANSYRQLRSSVNRLATKLKCTVLVHCSAGIGRTGTYAAIEIGIRQLVHCDKDMQSADMVRALRDQRASAVQNDLQYVFIHRAIVDAALEARKLGLSAEEREKRINPFVREYEDLIQRKRRERMQQR